jgi:hypothetical protein
MSNPSPERSNAKRLRHSRSTNRPPVPQLGSKPDHEPRPQYSTQAQQSVHSVSPLIPDETLTTSEFKRQLEMLVQENITAVHQDITDVIAHLRDRPTFKVNPHHTEPTMQSSSSNTSENPFMRRISTKLESTGLSHSFESSDDPRTEPTVLPSGTDTPSTPGQNTPIDSPMNPFSNFILHDDIPCPSHLWNRPSSSALEAKVNPLITTYYLQSTRLPNMPSQTSEEHTNSISSRPLHIVEACLVMHHTLHAQRNQYSLDTFLNPIIHSKLPGFLNLIVNDNVYSLPALRAHFSDYLHASLPFSENNRRSSKRSIFCTDTMCPANMKHFITNVTSYVDATLILFKFLDDADSKLRLLPLNCDDLLIFTMLHYMLHQSPCSYFSRLTEMLKRTLTSYPVRG